MDTDKFDTIVRLFTSRYRSSYMLCIQANTWQCNTFGIHPVALGLFSSYHMNTNYGKLSVSDRVDNGGFTDIEDYDKIWRKMELHAKGNQFQKRVWKDFEEALNKTWKCNFFQILQNSICRFVLMMIMLYLHMDR